MPDLHCPIAEWGERAPDQIAIVTSKNSISYAALAFRIEALQRRFAAAGIATGDLVALQLPNSVETIATIVALLRIGATSCLINGKLPVESAQRVCAELRCACLIRDDRQEELPVTTEAAGQPVPEFKTRSKPVLINADRPVIAVFTSGSSGSPKAALLSYGNLYCSAVGSNDNIRFGASDRWLLSLPLYHVGGLGILFRAFIAGGTVVLPSVGVDPATDITKHQITHISLVPTQLQRLLRDPANLAKLKSLKAVLLGGGPIPSALIHRALEASLPIYASYGLTEMASQVTTTRAGDSAEILQSAGKLLKYRELKLSPEDEIMVKGATRFLGYLTPKGIERPFDRQGWYLTGDLGRLDQHGNLIVRGRRDNMFISGGENIHPEEIEKILLDLPDIEEAIVVPVTNSEYGFRPVVFIRTFSGRLPDRESLKTALQSYLPGYKIPDQIFAWPKNDTQSSLKPSRAELAREATRRLRQKED